jgi:hypothetical protein
MPHGLGALLDPRSDEDKVPPGTNLDDATGSFAFERPTLDDVLSLPCCRVALPVDDVAREDDVFDVEDADFIIVQLIGCVKGDKVLDGSDLGPKTIDKPCHPEPILAWY